MLHLWHSPIWVWTWCTVILTRASVWPTNRGTMAQTAQSLPRPVTGISEVIERPPTSLYRDAFNRLLRNRASVVGLLIVGFFSVIALTADFIAPHNALESFPGNSERFPAWVADPNPAKTGDPHFLLGTDSIGRDVLSRVIF